VQEQGLALRAHTQPLWAERCIVQAECDSWTYAGRGGASGCQWQSKGFCTYPAPRRTPVPVASGMNSMGRSHLVLLCLALAFSLVDATSCPTSNKTDISCYCSTNCKAANGPGWNAPVNPPVSADQGTDTICVTVSGAVCVALYCRRRPWDFPHELALTLCGTDVAGVCSGNNQQLYNTFAGAACTPGANFSYFTSFSQFECGQYNAQLGNAANAGVYYCTSSNCNAPSTTSQVVIAPNGSSSPSSTASRIAATGLLAALAMAAFA
jgi:hypothetical protein